MPSPSGAVDASLREQTSGGTLGTRERETCQGTLRAAEISCAGQIICRVLEAKPETPQHKTQPTSRHEDVRSDYPTRQRPLDAPLSSPSNLQQSSACELHNL